VNKAIILCRNPLTILLVCVPVILQVAWQFTNRTLPVSDAGDHFRIAYLIYLAFKDGFLNGLTFIFHTGGKPILFSVFAAPFIQLFPLDPLRSIAVFLVLIQAATSLGYYLLLSYKLDPLRSALITALITTSPYVFSMHTQFMPETSWHMWFVFFLAALLRSEGLTKGLSTFLAGFFLGLTILTRPAESIVLIAPAFGVYLLFLFNQERLIIGQLVTLILVFFVATVWSSIVSWNAMGAELGLAPIGLGICAFLLAESRNHRDHQPRSPATQKHRPYVSSQLKYFFLPLTVILSVWLLFYARHIFVWTFDNSFGEGAKTNDQINLSKNIFIIIYDVLYAYGLPMFVVTFVLAAYRFMFVEEQSTERGVPLYVVFSAVAMVIPMLFAYSITGTSDNRRIFIGIVFLLIAASFYACPRRGEWNFTKIAGAIIIASLVSMQGCEALAAITQNISLLNGKAFLDAHLGPLSYRTPGAIKSEDAGVITAIKSRGVHGAKIAVFSLGMFSDRMLYQAESLRYVTLRIDRSLEFGTMWGYIHYEPYLAVISRLRTNGFEYVLLEDIDNPISDPVIRNSLRSHTFFVHDILSMIAKLGARSIDGLELVDTFEVGHRKQYLFAVRDPYKPSISATSQLASFAPDGLMEAKQPGWHSAQDPHYPQTIQIDLKMVQRVSSVGFLPQDGNASRGPQSVDISVSGDGTDWISAANSGALCKLNDEGWHDVKLDSPHDVRFIRISIYSNCGSPDLLTLRGLRFD
jgi:hypothetical protein